MYKVMLVDDYEIFRMEIKRMNIWKYNPQFQIVAEASNGIEAIAFLEKNQVDVLITDIRMPQIDGIELLKIASERKLCPVVILLSDYTEYNYARQCLVHGAFDYYYYSFIIDTYGSDKEMFIAIMKYTEQELRKKIIGDFPWIGLYYKESLGDLSVKIEEGINVVKYISWRELGTVIDIIRRLIYIGDNEIILRTCNFILGNISDGISVQSICENIFISKAYLSEQFKKNMGISLLEYINMVKIERTKFLLSEGKMKNCEIAEQIGFKDCEYFNKVFKKYTGMTMREYRNIK